MVSLKKESSLHADPEVRLAELFARAVEWACEVHWHQVDKAGAPYLLHPLRMMLRMETLEEKMVALLHDVVEDSSSEKSVTLDDLRRDGFSEEVVKSVDCLTKRKGDKNEEDYYRCYLEKVKGNALARKVKLADLEDNMDLRRLKLVTPRDMERLNKYKKAVEYLSKM